MNRWTQSDIEHLSKSGKIRGYEVRKPKPLPGGRTVAKHYPKRGDKHKDWIAWNLLYWCNAHAVTLEEEYRFSADRKWRFDYAIPALKLAIEYEGLNSEKSRHTTLKGYTGDTDKYNGAQQLGWKVLRFTVLNYKTMIAELEKFIPPVNNNNL